MEIMKFLCGILKLVIDKPLYGLAMLRLYPKNRYGFITFSNIVFFQKKKIVFNLIIFHYFFIICFNQKNTSSVCGIVSSIVDRSPVLFTGSSDQRIRYWDLNTRTNCSMIAPASRDYATGSNFSYE